MNHKLTWALGAVLVLGALAWKAAENPAADALANCNVSDVSLDGEEQSFLSLLNNYRASNGLAPLASDAALVRAATWMATDLAGRSQFGHRDSLGRTPWQRMPDCGVSWPGGENLAGGTEYAGAQTALDAWIKSPTHRDLMLASDFKTVGVARVYGQGSYYGWYWVTDFGYTASESAPAATSTPTPAPTATPAPQQAAPPPPAPAPAPPTLSLGAGISLVSWEGGYVSPEAVFGPKADSVSVVYVFDLGTRRWLRWGPGLDPEVQTLTELRNGVSYWVVTTQPIDVSVLR